MSERIFKDKFFLNFHRTKLEEKFSNFLHIAKLKYNPWFSLLGLILSIADSVYESLIYSQAITKGIKYIKITITISYIVSGLFFLQFLLGFIVKNLYFQKVIAYMNYVIMIFPFFNIREILYHMKYI